MEGLKDIMMRRREQATQPIDDKMILAQFGILAEKLLGDFARIYIAHVHKESRMIMVHVSHPIVYYELLHNLPAMMRELSAQCGTPLTIHCKMRI